MGLWEIYMTHEGAKHIPMNEALDRIKSQAGPCGIVCGSCPLGSGAVAESAGLTKKHIVDCQIPMWSPFVPGGEVIDWAAVDRGLDWMEKYAVCAGCGNGGGPPDCTIRICARERGYELCSSCQRSGLLHQVRMAQGARIRTQRRS